MNTGCAGLPGCWRIAIRTACGMTSLSSSSRFAFSSVDKRASPVVLPPGRARPAIKPRPNGSAAIMTIGIVCAARAPRAASPDGVASMALDEITAPTLIVSHRKDACKITPAADAPKLSKRLIKANKAEIALLDGDDPPQSDPCGAKAPHGYFGMEAKAVNTIAKFISDNSK